LVAADLMVALAAASDQHLVTAALVEVAVELHCPATYLHQAEVPDSVDVELGWADLDPDSQYYLHWVHGYSLDYDGKPLICSCFPPQVV
jgi:DNA primase